MSVDISDLRNRFRDGWTEDDIECVLADLSARLGLELVCVWEYEDDYGFGGHSDLAVIGPDGLHAIPDGLWDLLVNGDGDGTVVPVSGGPHPDLHAAGYRQSQTYRSNAVLDG